MSHARAESPRDYPAGRSSFPPGGAARSPPRSRGQAIAEDSRSSELHHPEGIRVPRLDALEGLASLVDKNLVQVQGKGEDTVSYSMLESIRDYALGQLVEAGELDAIGRNHALYYLALAERADENLRAALRWLFDHDEGELALRLATALGYFWEARGYMAEGRRQLDEALARAPAADPHIRARALSRLGALLIWLATEVERPTAVLTEALDLARSVQDTLTIARSLSYLGVLGLHTKEWDRSHRHLEEALTYWQEAQHAWGIAYTLVYLGAIELVQEHRQEAVWLLEESVAGYREMGDESARGVALMWLVMATREPGEVPGAATLLQELLALSSQAQDRRLMYLCAAGVAWLLRDQGDPEQLARLLGAAQQLRETMGIVRGVVFRTRVVISIATETLQARLGQESFEVALAEGRSMSFQQMAAQLRQALDAALQAGAHEETARGIRQPGILSPREQEVLQLVAEGFSNKQIAKQLIIAESTAKYYVTSIFNKLGVDTRAQAVAVAAQRGLL